MKSFEQVVVISNDNPGNHNKILWKKLPFWIDDKSHIIKMIRFVILQFYISFMIMSLLFRYKIVTAIFIPPLLLPQILLMLLGIVTIMYRGGVGGYAKIKHLEPIINSTMVDIPLMFANNIVVESYNSIEFQNLTQYGEKILIIPQYVDTNIFHCQKPFCERGKRICFVGNFTESKGVTELIEAVHLIENKLNRDHWSIQLIGNGPLYYIVKKMTQSYNLEHIIEIKGNLLHKEVVGVLNDSRIMILPTKAEGLPNVILEAMACGTVVISTPVGGIPDVIKDGFNGFLLTNLNPEHIAQTILSIIDHADLDSVSINSIKTINDNFIFRVAEARWNEILN